MTRKSKREIEAALAELTGGDEASIQAYLWADLKDAYGGRLTPRERTLLDSPDQQLPPAARAKLDLRR